jgi:hypothetical protein
MTQVGAVCSLPEGALCSVQPGRSGAAGAGGRTGISDIIMPYTRTELKLFNAREKDWGCESWCCSSRSKIWSAPSGLNRRRAAYELVPGASINTSPRPDFPAALSSPTAVYNPNTTQTARVDRNHVTEIRLQGMGCLQTTPRTPLIVFRRPSSPQRVASTKSNMPSRLSRTPEQHSVSWHKMALFSPQRGRSLASCWSKIHRPRSCTS